MVHPLSPQPAKPAPLYARVRGIIDSARAGASRSVDTLQVVACWLIGREIVEDEQKGRRRAGYGERLLEYLAARLKADYGRGYSVANLRLFRQFYLVYSQLLEARAIRYTLCSESSLSRRGLPGSEDCDIAAVTMRLGIP